AHRVAAGHQRRTRGHAVAFDIEIEELRALRGQRVDARRGRAADRAAAIASQFAPAEIVGQDQHDIGMLLHLRHEKPPNQSSLMFSSVTRRPQSATSLWMKASNSAASIDLGVSPISRNLACTSGCAPIAAMASDRRLTIAGGVPRGA